MFPHYYMGSDAIIKLKSLPDVSLVEGGLKRVMSLHYSVQNNYQSGIRKLYILIFSFITPYSRDYDFDIIVASIIRRKQTEQLTTLLTIAAVMIKQRKNEYKSEIDVFLLETICLWAVGVCTIRNDYRQSYVVSAVRLIIKNH